MPDEETPPPSYLAVTSHHPSLSASSASLTSRVSSPLSTHLLDTPVPDTHSEIGATLTPELLTPSHLTLPDLTPPHHGNEQPGRSIPTTPAHIPNEGYTPASMSMLDGATATNSPALTAHDGLSTQNSVAPLSLDGIVEESLKAKRRDFESGETASSATLNEKYGNRFDGAPLGQISWQEQLESNGLVKFVNLPNWRQDNPFIVDHHRPTSYSYKKSIRSIFSLHNETVNIHSHLIGLFLFALSPIWIYLCIFPRWHNATAGDFAVFALYFLGVAICFLLSFWFHTVANHSRQIAEFWVQFDFVGIVILMWGATIATVYYGFYCDHYLRWVYWSIVTVLSILCIISTLYKGFQRPMFRPYRTLLFVFLGISSLFFIVHAIKLHGWLLQYHRMSLQWMAIMALLNFTGAAAYAARIPERWTNGKTDVWGHSHQWLHIFVVLAGCAHAIGLIAAFDYVHGPGVGGDCSVTRLPTNITSINQFVNGTMGNSTLGNSTLGNATSLVNSTLGAAKGLNTSTDQLLAAGNLTRLL